MEKSDYKTKLDEIRDLLRDGRQDDAIDELDSMNWRKIHNVNALMKASEVYESTGRLDSAYELLEIAHERSPIGRMIIYRLAMLSIKLKEFEQTREYYDEFVEIAPHDSLKYVIRYELNKAKGTEIQTLIGILEELKEHDFIEQWAFELASLYHKSAQVDKCIALCDEIILWFGEGPYVERALELKMLYHPLDKQQEDKYRVFQQKRDGITEIRPEDDVDSSQILNHTVMIPQVELPPERFDTINLQAEIKKNIEEIMQATEAGEVSENMEAIKDLVGEFPFLQVADETAAGEVRKREEEQQIDESLKNSFQEYLVEEYDGQMSMFLPEKPQAEAKMEGQLTIDDVMANWEKTKRAAEQALEDAKQQRFENAKAKALEEANQIIDKLEGVADRLDEGATPHELLKEEYMARSIPAELTPLAESVHIPVVEPEKEHVLGMIDKPESSQSLLKKELHEWKPPVINRDEIEDTQEEEKAVDVKEASKIVADMNHMLQKQIDKLYEDYDQNSLKEEEISPDMEENVEPEIEIEVSEIEQAEMEQEEPEQEMENLPTLDESSLLADAVAEIMNEQEKKKDPQPDLSISLDEEVDLSNTVDLSKEMEREIAEAVKEEVEDKEEALIDKICQETKAELAKEEKEDDQFVRESALEEAVQDEAIQMQLTEEEREMFSYFTPISGMEEALCQVLVGARERLTNSTNSNTGNIMIQGGRGSGKTTLATNLIKVLQKEIHKPVGTVGKISADKLNDKDLQKLFEKISGGTLIIENAGEMTRETAVTLSLLMENDTTGILVILEDGRIGLERAKSLNGQFTKKFTEKITIPILTIDELVNFGKAYAEDLEYGIDEMGILALYDRINLISRLDHPTYLTEVKEIVDEAIDRSDHKGFLGRFSGKKYDEEGHLILQEKDFFE